MYTQCPECRSVFSLDASLLAQAYGCVVCGHCGATFDSLATLCDELPPDTGELAINRQALEPPRLASPVPTLPQAEPDVVAEAPITDTEPADGDAQVPVPIAADDFSQLTFAPRFVKSARPRKPPRTPRARAKRTPGRRLWGALCALLAVLLAAQLAWIGRDALTRNPTTGLWLRNACVTLGCRLPLVAAPARLQLLASNVHSRPDGAGRALTISLSVRNRADFALPWPVVGITLFDARHQRLAMRRLLPRDYLDDPAALRHGLAPGATAALLLEVQDPGTRAVAYAFRFQ